MEQEIEAYVKSCMVCQLDKTERRKEVGLLQPLSISDKPWQSASMDFISGFLSANSCKLIMVVIDCFSKYAVFVVLPGAYPTKEAAKLFHNHVVKYFSLPEELSVFVTLASAVNFR